MSSLGLDEQEQLDNLRDFWRRYGTAIVLLTTLVLAGFALKNGWAWWERREAAQAAVVFEKIEKALGDKNVAQVKASSATLLENHKRSTYAQRGALLAAKAFYEAGDRRSAQAQLQWVVDHAKDPEYAAVARIRLAGVLLDDGQIESALKLLQTDVPAPYKALLDDRKGDVLVAKNDAAGARQAYTQALAGLDDRHPWRPVVQMKMESLPQ
ncbi:MAG: YfgM family protein [Burkholderiaceae bacterium]